MVALVLSCEEPGLGGQITFHGFVAIQVVRAEIEQHADLWAKCVHRFELKGRDLENGHVERLPHQLEGRFANISRRLRAKPGRSQHGLDQPNGRRFSVRAGHGDHRNLQEAERQLDIPPGSLCLRGITCAGDPGARDDQIEITRIRKDLPRSNLDSRGQLARVDVGAFVCHDHPGATFRTEARRAGPGHAETQDEHFLSREVDHQRSFNEESATSARMIETIQNRTTICCSGHPSCSKWWWTGAIRKTRRPVILNEAT